MLRADRSIMLALAALAALSLGQALATAADFAILDRAPEGSGVAFAADSSVFNQESPVTLAAATETQPAACAAPSCGDCGTWCNRLCRSWIAQAEVVWLSPVQHQDFGIISLGNDEWSVGNSEGLTATPRITVGVQGECWGLVGRYWRLETGDLSPDYSLTTNNGTLPESCLQAETADLEVTRLLAKGDRDVELRASFGVRYAQFKEAGGLEMYDLTGNDYYHGSVFSMRDFSGAGITAGLTGIRPIGDGCFNLFISGRVSVLWDDAVNSYSITRATYVGSSSAAGAVNSAAASDNASLFIGEIQLGGQWNYALKCMPANAFLRAAIEYQYWSVDCSADAAAYSYAGPIGGPLVTARGAVNGDSHMDLLGFSIGTGLTW